jgi:hypothetical protein
VLICWNKFCHNFLEEFLFPVASISLVLLLLLSLATIVYTFQPSFLPSGYSGSHFTKVDAFKYL